MLKLTDGVLGPGDTAMNYSLKMNSLKERAHNKAFAKLTMLEFEIADLASDLKAGRTGGITYDELSSILVGTKVEREVWSYIMELIEKNNKNE
tara:strand:+ start:279 stop:557 length:279 start_codon:yes stop_codon:yes gene_type:complete